MNTPFDRKVQSEQPVLGSRSSIYECEYSAIKDDLRNHILELNSQKAFYQAKIDEEKLARQS